MTISNSAASTSRKGRRIRTMQRAGIALLRIDRPAGNALDDALLTELTSEVERLQGNCEVRVLIITGAGRAFCTGCDLKALDNAEQFATTIRLLQKVSMALLCFDKPIIAALNGPALGAGLSVALNCDVRVATTDFYCEPPEVRLGSTPTNGASLLLPLLIGPSRARLLLSGMRVDAQACLRMGLVDELTGPEHLLSRAIAIAEEFASSSRTAVATTRGLLTTALRAAFTATLSAETSACLAAIETSGAKRA